MWKDPLPRIERLKVHKAVLSPNFSVYTEMPVAVKIYNTFGSRWCGAFLQENGVKVIPTLAWGGPETFWFCFDGIEKNSIVAISTVGVKKEKDLFMQGYKEMLRRLKPSKIICYGTPLEEMKGDIIEVDYAKTNNYEKGFSENSNYIKKVTGCVASFDIKGMGGASVSKNVLPKNDAQIKHIFRDRKGHISDTPSNRKLLEDVANNKENYMGTDKYGNEWYSQTQSDGSQVWAITRDGTIQNGGINNPPKIWNSDTGYSRSKGVII